jgi:hypothetical protein
MMPFYCVGWSQLDQPGLRLRWLGFQTILRISRLYRMRKGRKFKGFFLRCKLDEIQTAHSFII